MYKCLLNYYPQVFSCSTSQKNVKPPQIAPLCSELCSPYSGRTLPLSTAPLPHYLQG